MRCELHQSDTAADESCASCELLHVANSADVPSWDCFAFASFFSLAIATYESSRVNQSSGTPENALQILEMMLARPDMPAGISQTAIASYVVAVLQCENGDEATRSLAELQSMLEAAFSGLQAACLVASLVLQMMPNRLRVQADGRSHTGADKVGMNSHDGASHACCALTCSSNHQASKLLDKPDSRGPHSRRAISFHNREKRFNPYPPGSRSGAASPYPPGTRSGATSQQQKDTHQRRHHLKEQQEYEHPSIPQMNAVNSMVELLATPATALKLVMATLLLSDKMAAPPEPVAGQTDCEQQEGHLLAETGPVQEARSDVCQRLHGYLPLHLWAELCALHALQPLLSLLAEEGAERIGPVACIPNETGVGDCNTCLVGRPMPGSEHQALLVLLARLGKETTRCDLGVVGPSGGTSLEGNLLSEACQGDKSASTPMQDPPPDSLPSAETPEQKDASTLHHLLLQAVGKMMVGCRLHGTSCPECSRCSSGVSEPPHGCLGGQARGQKILLWHLLHPVLAALMCKLYPSLYISSFVDLCRAHGNQDEASHLDGRFTWNTVSDVPQAQHYTPENASDPSKDHGPRCWIQCSKPEAALRIWIRNTWDCLVDLGIDSDSFILQLVDVGSHESSVLP